MRLNCLLYENINAHIKILLTLRICLNSYHFDCFFRLVATLQVRVRNGITHNSNLKYFTYLTQIYILYMLC